MLYDLQYPSMIEPMGTSKILYFHASLEWLNFPFVSCLRVNFLNLVVVWHCISRIWLFFRVEFVG